MDGEIVRRIKEAARNDPWKLMRLYLNEFWERFGGRKNARFHGTREARLRALVEYAAIRIPFKNRMSVASRRVAFDKIKDRRLRLRSHWQCFVCGAPAQARHHIIQIHHGGHDAKRNLVALCDACHAVIHPWMARARTETDRNPK